MNIRVEQKRSSRDKILQAASRSIRCEGVEGTGVAAVMKEAGLTHGGFYAHFKNKSEMINAAMEESLLIPRKWWTTIKQKVSWGQRLKVLAKKYLTTKHRDSLETSCSLAALVIDAGRGDNSLKQTYQNELLKSLSAICQEDFKNADKQKRQEALSFISLMVGGLTISRAVSDEKLSKEILQSCQKIASQNVASELVKDK